MKQRTNDMMGTGSIDARIAVLETVQLLGNQCDMRWETDDEDAQTDSESESSLG